MQCAHALGSFFRRSSPGVTEKGWHDRHIVPGQKWGAEIDRKLEEADVVLLLVSADFLASDHCYDIEMNRAMERHEAGQACVIPIILRECNWEARPSPRCRPCPKTASR